METYFTAVLELGDMFGGGGVPIDHYIIQVDNGTQLETPAPTYSFDIMYNTTLTVSEHLSPQLCRITTAIFFFLTYSMIKIEVSDEFYWK